MKEIDKEFSEAISNELNKNSVSTGIRLDSDNYDLFAKSLKRKYPEEFN